MAWLVAVVTVVCRPLVIDSVVVKIPDVGAVPPEDCSSVVDDGDKVL